MSAGRYMQITNTSASTYINGSSGLQGVGNMRYNTSNQSTEVFDGNNWITLNMAIPAIGLSYEAELLLDWARQKRDEELTLNKMAQEIPAIKDLVGQIKEKQEQIKMVQTLLKSPGNNAEHELMRP